MKKPLDFLKIGVEAYSTREVLDGIDEIDIVEAMDKYAMYILTQKRSCKKCKNWNAWDNGKSWWGSCKVINDRIFIYPEVEDCMDVSERTNDFCNHSHGDFGCILFEQK